MSYNFDPSDIIIDYTNSISETIGTDHGISTAELEGIRAQASKAHVWLEGLRKRGEIGFYDLPYTDTKPFKIFASRIREKFDNFVVLGIGGSALGTTAVHTAMNPIYYNMLTKRKRNGYPRLFVADNIDPDWFDELLRIADPKKTIFNVISKSGSTAETMSQFMIVFDMLKKRLKGKWTKKVVVTTDAEKGVLREIVREFNLNSFEVPKNVGGRFSVFTAVGLVPLACAGIDINGLLAGAARMSERCSVDNLFENPAYLFSAIHYLADVRKGKKMSIMMPYSNRLYGVADWYSQMWAESLGKRHDLEGKEVYTGQTPIKALGATDQHSQVQLYVEGPFDKIVVFIEIEKFAREVIIPEVFSEKETLKYLGGKSLNELMSVEKKGTEYALTSHNRPNITIRMPELNAYTLGQLFFMLEVATAFSGGLYGINPFDQPGVEFGKNYTYAMMGRSGYEQMKTDIESRTEDTKKKTI